MTDEPGNDLPAGADAPPADPAARMVCWRCGKSVPSAPGVCSFCQAPLRSLEPAARFSPPEVTLLRLLGAYTVTLGCSVLFGLSIRFGMPGGPLGDIPPGVLLNYIILLEVVWTLAVCGAFWWVGRPAPLPLPSLPARAATWCLAWPALAALLVVNLAYHQLLSDFVGVAVLQEELVLTRHNWIRMVLAICVQPALVEELFFRYLIFGRLREVMGGHAAVWIAALMFALAHVGVLLSIPVLLVLGVLLGYARLAGGGLALPVLMHLAHNAAVMTVEAYG